MKQYINLVVVLTSICLAAGLSLAIVNNLTFERIQQVAEAKRMKAIAEVLPESQTPPAEEVFPTADGGSNVFFVARDAYGAFLGAATQVSSPNGYGGDIVLMVGFDVHRELRAIAVLEQKETPGLGAKINTDDFKGTYAGRAVDATTWKVGKDGGDLDAITAATISSRAVAEAVAEAVERFTSCWDKLTKQEPFVLEELAE